MKCTLSGRIPSHEVWVTRLAGGYVACECGAKTKLYTRKYDVGGAGGTIYADHEAGPLSIEGLNPKGPIATLARLGVECENENDSLRAAIRRMISYAETWGSVGVVKIGQRALADEAEPRTVLGDTMRIGPPVAGPGGYTHPVEQDRTPSEEAIYEVGYADGIRDGEDRFEAACRNLADAEVLRDTWKVIVARGEELLAERDAQIESILEEQHAQKTQLEARITSALAIIGRHNHADLMSDDEWGELREALQPSEKPAREAAYDFLAETTRDDDAPEPPLGRCHARHFIVKRAGRSVQLSHEQNEACMDWHETHVGAPTTAATTEKAETPPQGGHKALSDPQLGRRTWRDAPDAAEAAEAYQAARMGTCLWDKRPHYERDDCNWWTPGKP